MKKFNVIFWDINRKEFIPYDVIPYLVRVYNEAKTKPKTFKEFVEFVDNESKYQWWSRCEYEIILKDWPCFTTETKVDIYWQIKMNIELIAKLLIESIE